MAAAIIFVLLFGVSSILHTAQMGITRTWFMIPFLIGGYCKYNATLAWSEGDTELPLT
jgi:hypothetical protein